MNKSGNIACIFVSSYLVVIRSSCSAGVRHTSADDCMMVMGVPLGLSRKAGALAFDLGPGSSSTQLLPVVVHG